MPIPYDQWLTKQPDRDTEAALETLLDCEAAKRKAPTVAEWLHIDRLERKAQAFLRG